MKSKFCILILLVVILIFGCATPRMYEGPKLPKDQVATVEGSKTAYLGVWFAVNLASGILTFGLWPISYVTFEVYERNLLKRLSYHGGNPPKIEVLPGHHRIIVNLSKESLADSYYRGPHPEYSVLLEFNAEAGHKYKVKVPFLWKKGSIVRLADTDSGEVVASKRFI